MRVSVNLHPESLLNILSNPRIRYVNLHDNRLAGAVVDPDEYGDAKRLAVDLFLFGQEGRRVTFGALSLGGIGLFSYGSACIILKNHKDLKLMTSFLEENSFAYVKTSPSGLKVEVPAGSRALWASAPSLALAKHEQDMLKRKAWSEDDLRDLLLHSIGDKKSDRYMEAQVVLPITRDRIERIVFSSALHRPVAVSPGIVGELAQHSKELAAMLCSSGKLAGIDVEVIEDKSEDGAL